VHYVRIYADEQGETHFEDVRLEAETRTSPGDHVEAAAPVRVQAAIFRRVSVDRPPEPHHAPQRQFVVHLAGETEIEVSDGAVRRFAPGAVVLAEDLAGKGHITRLIGEAPHETLFVTFENAAGDERAGETR
jgi:hypothetical protein